MGPTAPSQPGRSADAALADLIDELAVCIQEGEAFDAEQWLQQHPELAEQARSLLPAVQLLADLSRSGPKGLVGLSDLTAPETSGSAVALGTLGDFCLLREVGRGGMGIVYEAEQLSLHRRVALKVLPFAATLDPRQLQRFHNEARAAAGLEHPHIVQVHGVGCERGVHYYAMRLIEGQTLAALIAQQRQAAGRPEPLSPDDPTQDNAALSTSGAACGERCHATALLGKQVAEALHHAHELGVIHRDIKPSNLMVDGRGQAWVTDFGLAHLETGATLTRTGDLVGTLRYMAPEQASGQKALVDRRVDIYGLGVTLYELLTLCPAFPATTRAKLLNQVITSEPPAPRQLDSSLPVDLETIVLKAMAKEPEARYTTAQEMADDLGRFVNGEPILARPAGRLERLVRCCRRYPSRTALVAVTTLALLTILPGALWLFTALKLADADRQARQEAEKARAEAVKAKTVARYYSLVDRARRRSKDRLVGWTWRALVELQEAARLNFAGRDLVDLRTETALCLAGVDLRATKPLLEDFTASTLAFSPDGQTLAVAQHRQYLPGKPAILLFDWPSRTIRQRLPFPRKYEPEIDQDRNEGIRSLAFSPDGKHLAAGTRSGQIAICDLSPPGTWRKPWPSVEKEINWLAYSPDGRSLYSRNQGGTLICWDVAKRNKQARCSELIGWVPSLSPDGRVLAAPNLLESGSLRLSRPLPYPSLVTCFSPDGRLLAMESKRSILLVDVKSEQVVHTLRDPLIAGAHEGTLEGLSFSPDGSLLVSTCGYSRDRTVKLWEVASGRLQATLEPGSAGPLVARFSPDGKQLLVAADKRVGVYDIAGRTIQTRLAHGTRPVREARFSPDGRFLACVTRRFRAGNPGERATGGVTLWNLVNGQRCWEEDLPLAGEPENLSPLAFSPRGTTLASCGWAGQIHRLDLRNNKPLAPLPASKAHALSYSPGNRLWGVIENNVVQSWDWPEGIPATRWTNVADGANTLLCLVAGRTWVLVGGKNETVHLLRVKGGQEQRNWAPRDPASGTPVWCVALTRDERLAAWGTHEGEVRVADVSGGQILAKLKDHQDAVTAVAFDPSGRLLATSSRDRTVRLYVRAGVGFRPLLTLLSPTGAVDDVCFRGDGRQLAMVVHGETAVRIWLLDRLREHLTRMGLDDPGWPAFVDGAHLW
jgi:WD40 repeat protein